MRWYEKGCALEYREGQINSSRFWMPTDEPDESDGELDRFTQHWLEPFRRVCFLCGCDIEASAHEKAEWMQDLSAEEIQAWDLKL